ncbi:unnamed protein product [Arctogadus glacialis]
MLQGGLTERDPVPLLSLSAPRSPSCKVLSEEHLGRFMIYSRLAPRSNPRRPQLEAQPSPHSTLPALGEEELGGSASLRRRRSDQALRLPPADRHVFGAAPSLRSDTPRRPEEELLPKRSPPSPLHPRAGCFALFSLMLGFAMATVLLSSPPPLLTSQCGGRLDGRQIIWNGTDKRDNCSTAAAQPGSRQGVEGRGEARLTRRQTSPGVPARGDA